MIHCFHQIKRRIFMKTKRFKILSLCILVLMICVSSACIFRSKTSELKTIRSQLQLRKFYNDDTYYSDAQETLINMFTIPWSAWLGPLISNVSGAALDTNSFSSSSSSGQIDPSSVVPKYAGETASSSSLTTSLKSAVSSDHKDYSTTNIQVENVDEADITKTDGNYIYSLSENNVIITDASNPNKLKIASKITPASGAVPEDLLLYNNQLVVISEDAHSARYQKNTTVEIYNIDNKTAPVRVKSYQLCEPYYTSRCIGNKLYVISSGSLRRSNKDIDTYYYEDNNQKNLPLNQIHYLKDVQTNQQTLISNVDLDNPSQDIHLQSYLIDISNAYVSENNIYLLNDAYHYHEGRDTLQAISSLFGIRGILGVGDDRYNEYSYSSNRETTVYKFNIKEDGSIQYKTKTNVEGTTINQFSLDEYNGNLRMALHSSNYGSRIVILDENLNQIGATSYLAKGQNMYSSRFMGNKAYLVTYQNTDPLYVIDLTLPTSPKVLGELHIPGYSTYLHPYDETHLIGIGMETKETTRRDSSGRAYSTTAVITGMKMALFDVSNVNNPIQISNTIIGDRRTTSAILTNHKALLFSKEKELIAIPVNHYAEDFEATSSNDYSSSINAYTSASRKYVSEGYLIYQLNLTDGFKLKGKITHKATISNDSYSYYDDRTRLLRGLYIENNLFTISEDQIQVHDLKELKQISHLNIIATPDAQETENEQEKNTVYLTTDINERRKEK